MTIGVVLKRTRPVLSIVATQVNKFKVAATILTFKKFKN